MKFNVQLAWWPITIVNCYSFCSCYSQIIRLHITIVKYPFSFIIISSSCPLWLLSLLFPHSSSNFFLAVQNHYWIIPISVRSLLVKISTFDENSGVISHCFLCALIHYLIKTSSLRSNLLISLDIVFRWKMTTLFNHFAYQHNLPIMIVITRK